ncbi:MAG: pyrimidine reductase family protein, partial [Actinomycetota bacterium]|nr:pyrimidine reductase family protein [Actinomycetota bacterium]
MRVEGYGPARGADGPPIAVVSRSLALDWDGPLFTAARALTVVITCAAADPVLRRRAEDAAEVVVAGDERVDVARAIAELGRR